MTNYAKLLGGRVYHIVEPRADRKGIQRTLCGHDRYIRAGDVVHARTDEPERVCANCLRRNYFPLDDAETVEAAFQRWQTNGAEWQSLVPPRLWPALANRIIAEKKGK